MPLRVEGLAHRVLDGHRLPLEQGQQLAPRQLDALAQRALGAGGLQRAVQVVDGG
jgi:hypothetical protein